VHYWWGVKSGVKTPLAITVVLGLLLLARPILKQRSARSTRSSDATSLRAG
jgi:DMSO/TMAO reductase YedYZ heme-binding membrane subunit